MDRLTEIQERTGSFWLLEQLGKRGDILREGKLGKEKGQGQMSSVCDM